MRHHGTFRILTVAWINIFINQMSSPLAKERNHATIFWRHTSENGNGTLDVYQHPATIFQIWLAIIWKQREGYDVFGVIMPDLSGVLYFSLRSQLDPDIIITRQEEGVMIQQSHSVLTGTDLRHQLSNIQVSNDLQSVVYICDKDSLELVEDFIHTTHTCGEFRGLNNPREQSVITVIAACQNVTQLAAALSSGFVLRDPLVNLIMAQGEAPGENFTGNLPSNVETILVIPGSQNACRLTITGHGSGGNGTTFLGTGSWSCDDEYHDTHFWNRAGMNKPLETHIQLSNEFDNFGERHFLVGILMYKPFVYRTLSESGQEVYEGFCMEILAVLAKMMDFRYETVDLGNTWGYIDENGSWQGAIRTLMDGDVDMLMTGLTITAERQEVVDFTYPFWDEPLGLLTLTVPQDNFFLFKPLQGLVWVVYVFSAIIAAVALCSIAKGNLWCTQDTAQQIRKLTDYVWYTMAALTCQGGSVNLNSGSCRYIANSFWFCVMVIVATYSANLMSYLTVSQTKLPFSTLEEVVKADDYILTVHESTVARVLLEFAEGGIFADAWEKISSNIDEGTTDNFSQSVQQLFSNNEKRVIMDDLTALLDSAHASGRCNWGMLDESLLPMGFGMALPKGTAFKKHFDEAMILLHEKGIIVRLKRKYFGYLEEDSCAPDVQAIATTLTLGDIWPVFSLIGLGLFLSILCLVVERLQNKQSSNLVAWRH